VWSDLFDVRAQAWLEESLESLDKSLRDMGSRLVLRGGEGRVASDSRPSEAISDDAASQLISLVEQSGATRVFYHRAYTPGGNLEQVHMAEQHAET
jgi:deoxyribodipyrimidine photolyase